LIGNIKINSNFTSDKSLRKEVKKSKILRAGIEYRKAVKNSKLCEKWRKILRGVTSGVRCNSKIKKYEEQSIQRQLALKAQHKANARASMRECDRSMKLKRRKNASK
jgi:hypothetical protein